MFNEKQSQDGFKQWCRDNRLRLKTDDDNTPIAITRSKKYPKDHMFEGFENDDIGIAISRPTKQTTNNIIRRFQELGCALTQRGDYEANFRFKKCDAAIGVAKLLKIQKGLQTGSIAANLFKKREGV